MLLLDSLAALQEIDLRIDDLTHQAALLRHSIADDHLLRELQRSLTEATSVVQRHQSRTRELEYDVEHWREELTKDEARLYSGVITSTKDVDAIQHQITFARTHQRAIEDQQLETMEALDAATSEVVRRGAAFDSAAARRQRDVALWQEQLALVETRVTSFRTERAEKARAIAGAALQQYEQIRQRKGGRAIAPLSGSSCGACRVTLPAAVVSRARMTIQLCENCGRMLHAGRA